jgi:hypothetical protein
LKLVKPERPHSRKDWGCPMTKNRSNWCHAWCIPKDGIGDCGRIAPHALMGRTQRAIQEYNCRNATEARQANGE